MHRSLKYARDWLAAGHPVVLAIVTKTWGSAPRPVGSLMVIHALGHFEGSVSGGCIEGSVITEATAMMGQHESKILDFTVASADAWQVGLSCGGKIQIRLFPLGLKAVDALTQALGAIKARRHGQLQFAFSDGGVTFTDAPSPASTQLEIDEFSLSLFISPRLALVIIGAVHISQYLTPMAIACGYDVALVDPRELFIADRQFEGATLVRDWPDDYLQTAPLDASSAIVTLTHDPKLDDAALKPALESNAFYIGSLGSKKTHAARCARLAQVGYSAEQTARIKGPVGLAIGAKSPAEIAVSIMADITREYRDTCAL